MEALKSLIRKRGALKHKLTSFSSFLATISDNPDALIIAELEERVEKLNGTFNEFSEIQSDIEDSWEESKLDEQYNERDAFEKSYYAAIAKGKLLISNYKLGNTQNKTALDNESRPSSVNASNISSQIKLPVLQLPVYSGNYSEWLSFRDTFNSIIHNNYDLTDIQKLHYLKSTLQGQASQLIKSLPISDANYVVAWKLLCDRYDNKKLLINNHVKALFNLAIVKNECASELRKLIDAFSKHLFSLEALGQPVNQWGTLLLYLISSKLDTNTKREWEQKVINESPTVAEFQTFLKDRCVLLENLENQNGKRVSGNKYNPKQSEMTTTLIATAKGTPGNSDITCWYCNGKGHLIYTCKSFLILNPNDRTAEAKGKRLCVNCLKRNHVSMNCRAGGCRRCGKKHHSLLHFNNSNQNTSDDGQQSNNIDTPAIERGGNTVVATYGSVCNQVLLSTAILKIKNNTGSYNFCRALLDSGSESTFITSELCDKLGLRKWEINLSVVGINQLVSKIKYKTEIQIQSCYYSFATTITCFVIDRITENIPLFSFDATAIKIPKDIKLADNEFFKSNKIELLLGANIFWELICQDQIKFGKNKPVLQRTQLGWVLSGPINYNQVNKKGVICNFTKNIDIHNQLKAFWDIEEIDCGKRFTKDEQYCEDHFKKTTFRNSEGRFVVSIPFKNDTSVLGDSLQTANSRFCSLERKLEKNADLRKLYVEFMREYEVMGHMSKIREPNVNIDNCYYLPHHGVFKENSSTTKLRVVYDGSCQTKNNISLNDIQHIGPVIQEELFNILLRFRIHMYVLSADIEKMYRQVLINPNDRNFQRILWRENKSDSLEHYVLNTVTYGTASAPYLAIRSLHQVAYEYKDTFPLASEVILKDYYVDDLLTSVDNMEVAIQLYKDLNTILGAACFKLRKWVSNNSQILEEINSCNDTQDTLHIGNKDVVKTLGIIWCPLSDYLKYEINDSESKEELITKRSILSSISKLYDPLGLVGPCVIIAKIMLQQLWFNNLGWDDTVPQEIEIKWIQYRNDLKTLNKIEIPRFVCSNNYSHIELHTFSDASVAAYGACIYIRVVTENNIKVNLLCAKSRVSPIKRLTIPRLELCGALLAARLSNRVQESLNIKFNSVYYWCDSTIVLSWLKMSSNLLKVFVANRVSEIQELTNTNDWYHIGTLDNPADLISRGVLPKHLINSIWWKGPNWLTLSKSQWPLSKFSLNVQEIPECKEIVDAVSNLANIVGENWFFTSFSCWNKLQRTVAWCLRFINNCRKPTTERVLNSSISITEINISAKLLIGLSQRESFPQELKYLKGVQKTQLKSKIGRLSPFIDSEGLLRVGGRLQNSNFSFNKRHPYLICGKHPISELILQYEHKRLLHGGPQLILASVRDRYWPTGGRALARKIVYHCVRCARVKPKQLIQLMGNLPENRVVPMYPFHTTGVDYAGPFLVKPQKGRGKSTFKCYICLFVCFTTKAIHLEAVTELTSQAFLATLRRFVARRGKPANIYSDNGKNVVGAASELRELGKFLITNKQTIEVTATNENIDWHFIPANSPNFGGLWEVGVKSTKYHLKRAIGNALVTFEGFLTIITQIEGILNSRPLHPISTSPNDYEPLTPSHFLLGRSGVSVPDPSYEDATVSRLSRFQYLQQRVQQFWRQWSQTYITELQQRQKRTRQQDNVKIGDLVVIKNENLPPLKWRLGRISSIHPGSDGVVRVVTIKTSSGELKRAITKVCLLPIKD